MQTATRNAHDDAESTWTAQEEDLETVLERSLRELVAASEDLSVWRARIFVRLTAGTLVPLRMVNLKVITGAYLSMDPSQHKRLSQLGIAAPLSFARTVVASKLSNMFFSCVVVVSALVLCLEADPRLSSRELTTIFCIQMACSLIAVIEIVLQRLCIQTSLLSYWPAFSNLWKQIKILFFSLTFTEKKVARYATGQHATPIFHDIMHSDLESLETHAVDPSQLQLEFLDSDATRWNWLLLDIVATLPFFIEVAIYTTASVEAGAGFEGMLVRMYLWIGAPDQLRALRLLRILRLFKMGQKSEQLRIIWKAMKLSMDGISLLLLMVPLFVVFFGFLLFFAEHLGGYVDSGVWYYADGSVSKYQTIVEALWTVAQTLTTVGYGDITPATLSGRIVMMVSISVVTSSFSNTHKNLDCHVPLPLHHCIPPLHDNNPVHAYCAHGGRPKTNSRRGRSPTPRASRERRPDYLLPTPLHTASHRDGVVTRSRTSYRACACGIASDTRISSDQNGGRTSSRRVRGQYHTLGSNLQFRER
ncbi:hypothetical protein BC830DRAFT_409085 [Chytriomyces sp. MP71]|nr:hypothetical protein BC830DRAFT_409085 [Chytriomyces sp. MP71]